MKFLALEKKFAILDSLIFFIIRENYFILPFFFSPFTWILSNILIFGIGKVWKEAPHFTWTLSESKPPYPRTSSFSLSLSPAKEEAKEAIWLAPSPAVTDRIAPTPAGGGRCAMPSGETTLDSPTPTWP